MPPVWVTLGCPQHSWGDPRGSGSPLPPPLVPSIRGVRPLSYLSASSLGRYGLELSQGVTFFLGLPLGTSPASCWVLLWDPYPLPPPSLRGPTSCARSWLGCARNGCMKLGESRGEALSCCIRRSRGWGRRCCTTTAALPNLRPPRCGGQS